MNGDKTGKILIYGGTVEGRQVSDYLTRRKIKHVLCVATKYGEEVLTPGAYMTAHQGRMDREQMAEFMRLGNYRAVVDATHPYAVEASENIREACKTAGLEYLRYLRETDAQEENTADRIYVNSAEEAARYLEGQTGTVFLTTGSKELHVFAETLTDLSRLFVRVLPSEEVIASCRALGLEGKQICAMQGPFSADINEAMIRQAGARFLVTKDTGTSGGFWEKLEAAGRLGVQTVIIRRPQESGGYGWEELLEKLEPYLAGAEPAQQKEPEIQGFRSADRQTQSTILNRRISCVGIGMGTLDTLTHEAARVIREADILFGAGRILNSVKSMMPLTADAVAEYEGEKIASYLAAYPYYRKPVILVSGDVGFHSGARRIEKAFPGERVEFYCGISSVVYFAAKIPTAWEDARLFSAHGKQIAALNLVKQYPKLILLVGGREDVERICRELHEAGQKQVAVTVGIDLSYPQERIDRGRPEDFLHCRTEGLHIMMLENPEAEHIVTPGIPDGEFVRGQVPMTKEEVRILSVAKLRLKADSVVYDVGAGTGSVSAEIARLCPEGKIYAIERNPEGIGLIRENSRNLCLSNIVTVEGTAPEAMENLRAPTHAFIGGSAGNMGKIVSSLREKNPQVRIVINAISLESMGEVTALLRELEIKDADIVQITVARSRELGQYHMMTGLNPVYIVSFGGV